MPASILNVLLTLRSKYSVNSSLLEAHFQRRVISHIDQKRRERPTMIRTKLAERELMKTDQELKDSAEVSPVKLQNHHSIDAILGRKQERKQQKRHHLKSENPDEYFDDEEDGVTDTELSSGEAKPGNVRQLLHFTLIL